ncbi:threonine aldolase family protein [Spelaeicoccus albus]|uniref:Threonine aldolase n=1 Tax=Spelaeicoccus albus TaxID=1280376 RepID=A0A7Z0D513_9MICO|nr:GntG family PLP-dependent aldolase [Spelaeicoccus albus]NYI69011.1 threonine aldolase [Spelaeicoccus albus]
MTDAAPIDLRSDTVTRPGESMREAMAHAPVGDDVYGEDPTTNELEERVAELLGHEAGLFTPSGTLANMLGVRTLVEPGTELIADSLAHVVRAEMGGHAVLGGVTTRTWTSPGGVFRAAEPLGMMVPDGGSYSVSTAAVAIENTHNFAGGLVADIEELRSLRAGTSDAAVAVHLDGARLANASVASGVSLREYGELADSVSICLSKGLGAPVGSVLVGSAERIARARIMRKRYGGGMRQCGILAAAGLYALDNNIDRIADDHENAALIARTVAGVAPGVVDPDSVATNIVMLKVGTGGPDGITAAQFAADAADRGVLMSVLSPTTVRLVTHLDVSAEQAKASAAILAELATTAG